MADRLGQRLSAGFAVLKADLAAASTAPEPGHAAWLATIILISGGALAVLMLAGGYHGAFIPLNRWGESLPPALWANLTSMGDTLFALAIFLPLARRNPEVVWAAMLAAVFGTLYAHLLKHGLDTARPPAVFSARDIHIIGPAHTHGGFPSGHTVTAFTVAGLWICYLRSGLARAGVVAWACVVGLSRVMVGVHWPADVLAGACGGTICVWLGVAVARRWRWGLRPGPHLFFVALLAVAAAMLFNHDGKYHDAIWLARFTSVAALIGGLAEYLRPSRLIERA